MKKSILYLITTLLYVVLTYQSYAQDDLFNILNKTDSTKSNKQYVTATFKSTHVVLGQSVEIPGAGNLLFDISHHFGTLNQGAYNLFGLDQAFIRLGFEYSPYRRLSFGVGRSTYEKTYDGSVKYILIRQSTGKKSMPFTLTLFAGITINSLKFQQPERQNYFSSRLAYVYEILLARKFTENLSLQLSPVMIHKNLVALNSDHNDQYALGFSGRYKLTKRFSVNAEYFYLFPHQISGNIFNSLSVGFDLETGGHVFQIFLTNSDPMFEKGFITETAGSWQKGYIHLGFNINRTFVINKVKPSQKW